ncbi:hypothetical protein MNBD_GAMMA05-2423 [hydrothermal vent metagenome]|uniref:Uncharacterized protein n=1 Tax=hydrothermal vent metagenome TaxID=652676 RepID=A0A3B0WH44_9ZZZZ
MDKFYYFKLFQFCLVVIFVTACSNEQPQEKADVDNVWKNVTLPDLSSPSIKLSVANVVNPRFKQLTNSQIEKILNRTQQLVKQYFNVDVLFSKPETLSIESVFNGLDKMLIQNRRTEIIDINFIDKQDRENMQQALFKTLSLYRDNKNNVIEFAQPYLLQPEIKHKDFISFSYALADTLISRLSYWKNQTADDGKPVLDGSEYNQWVWWDSLGYGDLQYDVVLTNQLVASAENYGMDVHSSIRGGLTAGTTTYNKNTQFNSYVYIMVYPMLNNTDLLTTLRQDESYTEEQIINYSAALLTHELGHMLLHLGHPFGNNHCIMSPTVMLNYRDWYDNLDVSLCAVGSSKGMQVGAVELEYNKNW